MTKENIRVLWNFRHTMIGSSLLITMLQMPQNTRPRDSRDHSRDFVMSFVSLSQVITPILIFCRIDKKKLKLQKLKLQLNVVGKKLMNIGQISGTFLRYKPKELTR